MQKVLSNSGTGGRLFPCGSAQIGLEPIRNKGRRRPATCPRRAPKHAVRVCFALLPCDSCAAWLEKKSRNRHALFLKTACCIFLPCWKRTAAEENIHALSIRDQAPGRRTGRCPLQAVYSYRLYIIYRKYIIKGSILLKEVYYYMHSRLWRL